LRERFGRYHCDFASSRQVAEVLWWALWANVLPRGFASLVLSFNFGRKGVMFLLKLVLSKCK
jgi:hypothetical protein